MSLDERFQAAAEKVRTFNKLPTNEELLQIYALYKQATIGDNIAANKPGFLDLKAKAKYAAWTQQRGKTSHVAKLEYIDLIEQLSATYLLT